MRCVSLALVCASLIVGCATEKEEPLAFCEGSVAQDFDASGARFDGWPDDRWLGEDGISIAESAFVKAQSPIIVDVISAVDGLDGFARVGPAVLRFTGDVGEALAGVYGAEEWESSALAWVALTPEGPVGVAFEAYVQDDGKQVRLEPLETLRPKTKHVVLLRSSYSANGDCVAPSGRLKGELLGEQDGPANGLAEALGMREDALSAALVFTTHDATAGLRTVADALVAAGPRWAGPAVCGVDGEGKKCTREAILLDARDADGRVRLGQSAVEYTVPVIFWMPGDGPSTLMMFGHGLGGQASDAGGSIRGRMVQDLGYVMVATDALLHGVHPTAGGTSDPTGFLGISYVGSPLFSANRQQGNFVQTGLDRVQVLALIRADPDLDGDGVDDVNADPAAYWGISLGSLLAPAVLSLSDEVGAAVLSVGGGQLMRFAIDSGDFSFIKDLLQDLAGGEAQLDQMLAIAQTAVDAGDPAVFGAHVMENRFGGSAPDMLLPVSIWDKTVPPSTGRALARAMRLPHIGPEFVAVPPLARDEAGPWEANWDGVTAGYFQYDRVSRGNGEVTRSSHSSVPFSPEGDLQTDTFFLSWLETGTATILDPYVELDTPPL